VKFGLPVACGLALAMVGQQPVRAQESVGSEIAELRAENARLAARIAELERRMPPAPEAESAKPPPPSSPAQTLSGQPPGQPGSRPGRNVELTVPAAPADRPVQGGGIGLELSAASQGGQVSLTLGQSVRATAVQPDQVRAEGTAWSITASAPVDKGGGDTSLATLDSFSDSFAVKARIARLWMTTPNLLSPDGEYLEVISDAVEGCKVKAGSDQSKAAACEEADIDEDFIKANAAERLRDYHRLVTQQREAYGIGLEASVGYRHYSFLDRATATKNTSDKVPWGLKVFGTYLPGHGTALTASVAYQRGYKEGDALVVCPLPSPPSATICQSGPGGEPFRKDKVLLAFEARHMFDLSRTRWQNGVIDRIGLGPQFTYDAKNDEFGIDLPVYFVPDAKGNLIGGIRLGYKTAPDHFTAGVFVGGAFDLFKR